MSAFLILNFLTYFFYEKPNSHILPDVFHASQMLNPILIDRPQHQIAFDLSCSILADGPLKNLSITKGSGTFWVELAVLPNSGGLENQNRRRYMT